MMVTRYAVLFFLLSAIFSACVPEEPESLSSLTSYFDTKAYFEAELDRLEGRSSLSKKAVFKGKVDSVHIEEPDWSRELALFLKIDLQNVSYRGKFETDSIFLEDTLKIHYRASDPKIPVKQVDITFVNEQLTYFYCHHQADNILYSFDRELTYIPTTSFRIKGWQKTRFLNEMKFRIQAYFL